jgi:hypothetical protein
MKKLMIVLGCLMLVLVFSSHVMAGKGGVKGSNNINCVTIQNGILRTSDGRLITPGYNEQGYNYQALMFNGMNGEDNLQMKWNAAWLSNMDCDGDGLLDRHLGFPTYIGSGAWLTNHMSGTYIALDGNECKWTYFVKIVAAPSDAKLGKEGKFWYAPNGVQIGPVIWGQFAIIQEVYNDPSSGEHGVFYKSPVGPGFGKFKP